MRRIVKVKKALSGNLIVSALVAAGTVALLVSNSLASNSSDARRKAERSLYNAMLYPAVYSAEKIEVADLPEYVRDRVRVYKQRCAGFSSRLPELDPSRDAFIPNAVLAKKKGIEKVIFSLINKEGIEDIAAGYAKDAKLYYEWEGFSEGPLAEATYAEEFLNGNPETPIRPYLIIFILHRYKHAVFAVEYEKDLVLNCGGKPKKYPWTKETYERALKKYEYYLNMAKEEQDLLVGWFAGYIDKIDNAGDLY